MLRAHDRAKARSVNDAGVIVCVVSRGGALKFLLLCSRWGHWEFPKGRRRIRETPRAAALREVKEETGITDFFLFPGFRARYRYSFRAPDGRHIRESVLLFAAVAASRAVRLSEEHTAFAWLPFRAALSRLTYPSLRNALRRFERYARTAKKQISFQQRAYRATAKIPRGHVATYGDIARAAQRPQAARTVGALLNKNYDARVPCHRVVGAHGALVGYNKGTARKRALLMREGIPVARAGRSWRIRNFSHYRISHATLS